jgi:hypothetical protein
MLGSNCFVFFDVTGTGMLLISLGAKGVYDIGIP